MMVCTNFYANKSFFMYFLAVDQHDRRCIWRNLTVRADKLCFHVVINSFLLLLLINNLIVVVRISVPYLNFYNLCNVFLRFNVTYFNNRNGIDGIKETDKN